MKTTTTQTRRTSSFPRFAAAAAAALESLEGRTLLSAEITVFRGETTFLSGITSYDFGTHHSGDPAVDRGFWIRNDGDEALSLEPVNVPAGWTIVTDIPPGTSLAAGDTTSFRVALATGAVGAFDGLITFANGDADESPFVIAVAGVVEPPLAPEVTVYLDGERVFDGSGNVDFGSVLRGTPGAARTFTVKNNGTAPLTLGDVVLPAGFSITDNLVTELAPGAEDDLTIRLDSATAGTRSGSLSFATNDVTENPFDFAVAGVVTAPAVQVKLNNVVIADGTTTAVSFGTVARNSPAVSRVFTVTNTGNAPLDLGDVAVPAGFTVIEPLNSTLAGGASDTFTVRMPTTANAIRSGQLTFTTTDLDHTTFNFPIAGNVKSPIVALYKGTTKINDGTTTPISFGTVIQGQTGPSLSFTVKNTGNTALTAGALQVPSGFSVTKPLAASVAAGSWATFTLKLSSSATGTKGGQVSFATNDPDRGPYTFAVTGRITGVTATKFASGTLKIVGTDLADVISFSGTNTAVKVKGNGWTLGTFAGTKKILVSSGGGNDTVTLGTISLPSLLNGGTGNDTLTGGGGADEIRGGSGNDRLTGGFGRDTLLGEEGDDVLNGVDGTSERLDGGPGTDTIKADPTDSKSGT